MSLPVSSLSGRPPAPKEITIELLEACLDRVAQAIEDDEERGHAYLPIFERLERELEDIRDRQSTLARVRSRLKQSKGRMEVRSS